VYNFFDGIADVDNWTVLPMVNV